MREPVRRQLYRLVLGLHPRSFREEFADEMLWIFDQESATRSTLLLFGDAMTSLGRQWLLRGSLLRETAAVAPAPASSTEIFAWEHIGIPEIRLPISRVLQGGAVTTLFITILTFTTVRPARFASNPGQIPDRSVYSGISGGIEGGVSGGGVGGVHGGVLEGIDGGINGGLSGGVRGSAPENIWGTADPGVQDGTKTAAEQQFKAWLDRFNTGDRAKFQEYLEKNYPEQANHLDGIMGFRAMTGGFDLKRAEKVTDTEFVAIVKERDSDTFARMNVEVQSADPHRIAKFDVSMIPTPLEFAIPRMSEPDAIVALKAEIERRVAADRFSGAVMISKNGKAVFSGAYGLADRDKKTKNDLDTQFRIGSMNKMFTAVSTLQLVQLGKLKLDGTVGEYLPDYPNKDLASKVTIHHLLTHTGGTGDFFGPEFDKHRLELKSLQDYVTLYGQRGLEFEPGSKWDYSNYGFLLLGVIVQKVSGQDYYEYVREHVYRPAGMSPTDSLPEDQTVVKRSVGYMKDRADDSWKPNTGTLPYRGTSAGGGYSTVGDLQKLAQALKENKLLDAKHVEMLTTGKADTGGGDKYAYGFMDRTSGGVRSYGHGGGAPGMNGELAIYPESRYVVAVLANVDPPAAQRIAAFVGNRLPAK